MSSKFILLLSLLTVLLFIQLSYSANIFSKAKLHSKCKKVKPTKKLDMDFSLELFVGKTFYLTMGSRSAFEDLTELLSGTRASESSEIDKMCAEVTTKGFKSSIEGYNGNYLVVDCAIILDNKGVQDCTANPRTEFPDRHKSVSGIQTLAWTDNKENLVVVRCSHKGDKNDWVLYSFNTSISDEIKKTVEHQVSRMGFRPSEYPIHYSDYSNCNLTKGDD